MKKFGIKCGILEVFKISYVLLCLLMLCSCIRTESEESKKLIYAFKELNSIEILKRDTVLIKESNANVFEIRFKNADTLFFVKQDDFGIYLCDNLEVNCKATHIFKDSLLISNNSKTEIFSPYFSNDTRYLGHEKYQIGNKFYEVHKFMEDMLLHSHGLKYSYYVKKIGFIAHLDLYENRYSYLDEIISNNLELNKEIKLLIEKLAIENLFYDFNQKPVVPVQPKVDD